MQKMEEGDHLLDCDNIREHEKSKDHESCSVRQDPEDPPANRHSDIPYELNMTEKRPPFGVA
jgi:hypothetical protein